MKFKYSDWLVVVFALIVISCSSERERLITGKWSPTHTVIGGSPSSFWFKSSGTVIAPWETHSYAMQSEGTYEFTDDTHIRITMTRGYYQGNIYMFEIIKLDEKELHLGGMYEVLHLSKSHEKE
ncbi:MAG: hypothetical protein C4581_10930 [Nitrospiraceae bacterium]|nr:MAG: hypothetical protein C4581_10930 [Nitrospiraceae bacterium]